MPTEIKEIWKRWMDPQFKFFVNRKGSLKERMKFLLEEERMLDEYLGACLDYIRGGFLNGVVYELGTSGLIKFVQKWMKLNQDNLIWHYKALPEDFKLPHINYDRCPRNPKHERRIMLPKGKVRCAHVKRKKLRSSFVRSFKSFDAFSQMEIEEFYEDRPIEPSLECNDEETWDKYYEQLRRFEEEERSFEVVDICSAIISDERTILPLEKVLDRLNHEPKTRTVYCGGEFSLSPCRRVDELDKEDKRMYKLLDKCPGHEEENPFTVHPFDGWYLAWYIQKWYEQLPDGNAPIFNKLGERDNYKAFPKFTPLGSED